MDTIVLALGNPQRGDDGAGAAVLEALSAAGVPEGVVLVEGGTPGLDAILLVQNYRHAIIIDTAEMGREPGAWARFTLDEVTLRADDGQSHGAGLASALRLGDALGVLPADIVIYGIQPSRIDWKEGLSEPVQAAIPLVCAAILDELRKG